MALWREVNSESRERERKIIFNFYSSSEFPVELREMFANSLESAVWELNPDEPKEHESIARVFETMLRDLSFSLENCERNGNPEVQFGTITTAWKLRQILPNLEETISSDPLGMFRKLRQMIRFEMETLGLNNGTRNQANNTTQLISNQECPSITTSPKLLESKISEIQSSIETCNKIFKRLQVQKQMDFYGQQLFDILHEFEAGISMLLHLLCEVQKQFITCILNPWKLEQQHLAIGLQPVEPKDLSKDVQPFSEKIFESLVTLLKLLRLGEVEVNNLPNSPNVQCNIPHFIQTVSFLIEELVRETFVVIGQPPGVIQQGVIFQNLISACMLVGHKILPPKPTRVNLYIIDECQAKQIHNEGLATINLKAKGERTFEKHTDISQLEHVTKADGSSQVLTEFRKVKLMARVREGGKRGTGVSQFVMEKKFCLLLTTKIELVGLHLQTWTSTFPVTISTHKSQNPLGAARVIWDLATAKVGRVPFKVSESISWTYLADILSALFMKPFQAGINPRQLKELKAKAFADYKESSEAISWNELTRRKFPINTLQSSPNANISNEVEKRGIFSFWDWYYAALKTLEDKRHNEQLKTMWSNGFIIGFIQRETAEQYLRYEKPGTFLIRFSDSTPGAISIVCVVNKGQVTSIAPIEPKSLATYSLANRLKMMPQLKYFYNHKRTKDEILNDPRLRLLPSTSYGTTSPGSHSPYVFPFFCIHPHVGVSSTSEELMKVSPSEGAPALPSDARESIMDNGFASQSNYECFGLEGQQAECNQSKRLPSFNDAFMSSSVRSLTPLAVNQETSENYQDESLLIFQTLM